ncbi:NAD(+) synthase [Methylacidiphilum kamchatkense]|uniref:Glutamine-dependent NAD(+) synthetase n=1 Tax=Methylacidiphilum kamchatkense Kam1 TaxID=1202785 RepID=A0A516TNC2_9BACT|nr:NAD(+) synthase [Methylacidiphilum kamchatkense]QDQ42740.1 NAD+ synthase (glutamine-hydrolysing) [Methylacidiphilum kamchatkense Kam1]
MERYNFFNFYNHNFVRVAIAIPVGKVADPFYNIEQIIELSKKAVQNKSMLVVFPELSISSYSCEDLFHQSALLDSSLKALAKLLEASVSFPLLLLVGLPLQVNQLLFNCAALLCQGKILGIIPKSYLPNYREFYEPRQFSQASFATEKSIDLLGQSEIPFGTNLIFQWEEQPLFKMAVEICEDLWVPLPPSSFAALAGATILVNLSASNVTIGKSDYRKLLVASQSGRCIAAYLYSAAGFGESTTDLAWDGEGLIYENGTKLAETQRFSYESQIIFAEIDLDRLQADRMRQNSFGQTKLEFRNEIEAFKTLSFSLGREKDSFLCLERELERFPYVPTDPLTRDQRCQEVFSIQTQGLVQRLRATGISKVVIGVSGGLDSAHALIICAKAMDILRLPRKNIVACTMPGFATTKKTLEQARKLIEAIGAQEYFIDIRPSCLQLFKDIGHPFAQGQKLYDITFENVQAGERTNHLFRLANLVKGLVVGTSDLSELALGWSTYGVGDHMAHYHVNASVPKTLIKFLVRWVSKKEELGQQVSIVLNEVLDTIVSPELIPGEDGQEFLQSSEKEIGPYNLQDFHLYYTLRYGYLPTKTAFLAWTAWHDPNRGHWPEIEGNKEAYRIDQIKHWLKVFLDRFFRMSQFKRSCIANAPKVGSGGSLSPRSDYRAPSDSSSLPWLKDWERIPDSEESFLNKL